MSEFNTLDDIISAGNSATDVNSLKSHYLSIISSLQKEIIKTKATVRDFRDFYNTSNAAPDAKNISLQVWIDPVINNEILQLKRALNEKNEQIKNLENALEAQQFQPQSAIGRRLLEKLQTFQMENEELGKIVLESHSQPLNFELYREREKSKVLEKQLRTTNRLITELDLDNEKLSKQLEAQTEELETLKKDNEYLGRKLERLREEKSRRKSSSPRKSPKRNHSPKRRDRRSYSRHYDRKSPKRRDRRSEYRSGRSSRSRSKRSRSGRR
ncbi:Pre-mRNA-splicing regulator WTAP [Babesia duncani]|uniref:Pre-mRNA-splicing regulator WTAP n=1 Tax=Babesia duncani TaxID=323732 RepID=A0AAD9UPZ2_9APIC|nr:Pre-mRNA-splicing regulator WTAP [Babesia duncani]